MRRRKPAPAASARPSIVDFIDDPALLGASFAGPSWDRWRAVLRAAFALPMSDRDLKLFSEVSGGRAPPTRRVRELVCCIGRGGGKDSIASAVACYIATTGDFSGLRPGERGTIMLLAVDRDQTRIAFNYTRALFDETPMLSPLLSRVEGDRIHLTTRAEIVVQTANTRSPRGRTVACAIYDEVAHWLGDDYANPDSEIDNAISPGLMRFPGSLKILISSTHRRAGLLYQKFSKHFGQDDDDTLVVLGSALDFNPTLDAAEIDRQIQLDPERAGAEYLSRWRDDLSTFLDRLLVDAAVEKGVVARAPQPNVRYVGFVDPSGGRGDSFTAAVGHDDAGTLVLDCVVEHRAPFDSDRVIDDVSGTLKAYRINTAYGDSYGADLTVSAFRRRGIVYENLRLNDTTPQRTGKLSRSEIYLNSLSLFTSGRVRLLDNPRLVNQLISLERRAARSGHDSVDHPAGAHDDLANSVCGVLVALGGVRQPMIVTRGFVDGVRSRLRAGSMMPPLAARVQTAAPPRTYQPPRAASFVQPGSAVEAALERGGK